MKEITIKEVTLKEALEVFSKIPEWDRPEAGTVEYCEKRTKDKENIVLAAYAEDKIVGYLIGYEKDNSFYCWVAAVIKEYRRRKILTKMMEMFENRAQSLGYNQVTIKTLNNKREMLSYLIKNNWNFTEIIKNDDDIILNEIKAQKKLA